MKAYALLAKTPNFHTEGQEDGAAIAHWQLELTR